MCENRLSSLLINIVEVTGMEIQNMFLSIIWLCGFLVLCAGALWMLRAIWDSITILRGKTGDNKVVESFIEELNDIDVSVNAFSDGIPDETKD
jgi:hypothetical protein